MRFACLVCKAVMSAPDTTAGKKADCPGCGQRLQVPDAPPRRQTPLGRFLPGPCPAAVPAHRLTGPDGAAEEVVDVDPARPFARTVLAGFGAVLLLVGLFCPMLSVPGSFRVSFFDFSVITARTVIKLLTSPGGAANLSPTLALPPKSGPERSGFPSSAFRAAVLWAGLVVSAIAPFCPPLLGLLAALSLWTVIRGAGRPGGRSARLTLAGVICLLALLDLCADRLLLLWAAPNPLSDLAYVVMSFGFGWAVLLTGSILLLTAGRVR